MLYKLQIFYLLKLQYNMLLTCCPLARAKPLIQLDILHAVLYNVSTCVSFDFLSILHFKNSFCFKVYACPAVFSMSLYPHRYVCHT